MERDQAPDGAAVDSGHRRRSVGKVLRHEWTVSCLAGLLLAIVMTWLAPPVAVWALSAGETAPIIADPRHTIVGDVGDPALQAWTMAWTGHAILHDIGNLWRTNAFYPQQYALALSDSLIGYAPAGMIGTGPAAAVIRYNIMFVLIFALAFVGAYALVRQLGANRVGAAVAGAAFAYAPWRYGHDGHLHILSTGGIALALAMLARGHGWSLALGYRPERARPGWALAGWLVAAWQISLGFSIGLAFFYVLILVCVVATVGTLISGRPAIARRLVLCDLGGGVVFAVVSGYLASTYLRARDMYPDAERSWDYVRLFSAPPRGLLVAPRSSLPWGTWHDGARTALEPGTNEKVLLCGIVLGALAAAGLWLSTWRIRQRALLGVGVAVGAVLALGANAPLYRVLYLYVPGFDGIRTPGRLILWPTLLLGILAAGMVTELARRVRRAALPEHAKTLARVVTVPLLLAVLVEGLPKLDHPDVPAAPELLAVAPDPLIVLPTDEITDLTIQLWSTDRFPLMVNGASGINPAEHQAIRDLMRTFPSPASIDRLRGLGIRSVVVIRDRVRGTPFEGALSAPTGHLGIMRQEVGPDVLYTIE